jgi:hypothetical protein
MTTDVRLETPKQLAARVGLRERQVTLVAGQIIDDHTIELTFPANPDGKYLLKGGTSQLA